MHLQSIPTLNTLANVPEAGTAYGTVTAEQKKSLQLAELITGKLERADGHFYKKNLHDAAYFGVLLLLD